MEIRGSREDKGVRRVGDTLLGSSVYHHGLIFLVDHELIFCYINLKET